MPYYTAGDYYGRGDYYRGDGISLKGIVKGIGKVAGTVARVGVNLLPGPVGAVARGIAGAAGGGQVVPQMPPPVFLAPPQAPGTAVARQGRVSPLGTVGLCPAGMRLKKDGGCTSRRRPHMNVMNQRAAKRAITRISGVRKLLHSIEVALPKSRIKVASGKKCGCR